MDTGGDSLQQHGDVTHGMGLSNKRLLSPWQKTHFKDTHREQYLYFPCLAGFFSTRNILFLSGTVESLCTIPQWRSTNHRDVKTSLLSLFFLKNTSPSTDTKDLCCTMH